MVTHAFVKKPVRDVQYSNKLSVFSFVFENENEPDLKPVLEITSQSCSLFKSDQIFYFLNNIITVIEHSLHIIMTKEYTFIMSLCLMVYHWIKGIIMVFVPKHLRYKDVKDEVVLITGGGSGLGK